MTLGSLFAAGHAPGEVFGWSWGTIFATAQAINAYQQDLLARVMTGKSPALDAARREGSEADAREAANKAYQIAGLSPEQVEAFRDRAEATAWARHMSAIAHVPGSRFSVNTSDGTEPAAKLDGPAVFAAAKAARERGASPEEVSAIIAAGMAGEPLPVPGRPPG